VAVDVNVGASVIVAVHVNGNAPVSVIDLRRNGSDQPNARRIEASIRCHSPSGGEVLLPSL